MTLLLIDKPTGMTSHDVVNIVRKKTDTKKVGHAGTLDPMASGLLIVGVGRESTKKLGSLTKDTHKEYIAQIYLGEERDTLDQEGKIISENKNIKPTAKEVKKALKKFQGEIKQIPPKYSAIKINGKKAYEMARKGQDVKLEPRKVTVYKAELISYKYPICEARFEVSAGTYIRSLARDIGKELKTGGYLYSLKRTRIGDYNIDDAKKLEDL